MAYQVISNIFSKNEADVMASEAHGLATGMLCIENKIEAANWLAELFPSDLILDNDDKVTLLSLFEQTRQLLNEEDNSFRFDLFLPGEADDLSEQLEAVRYWCEGFLFGIGYTRSSSQWPGETAEIMKDIVEFTKMDTGVDDDLNDDEKDSYESSLAEIQEYLRVAVMMIRDQFLENNEPVSNN